MPREPGCGLDVGPIDTPSGRVCHMQGVHRIRSQTPSRLWKGDFFFFFRLQIQGKEKLLLYHELNC